MAIAIRIILGLVSVFATVGFLFSGYLFWAAAFFLLTTYLALARS
jgi:hypothetical protein